MEKILNNNSFFKKGYYIHKITGFIVSQNDYKYCSSAQQEMLEFISLEDDLENIKSKIIKNE